MKAFIYTELQTAIRFEDAPWQAINQQLKQQRGILNKTWLAGVNSSSIGGFYAFETLESAQAFVTDYFPSEAGALGFAQRTLLFDASATSEASKHMNSAHFGGDVFEQPGAFVYTEVQVSALPFEKAPWRTLNPILKKQTGLLSKTWLSGLHTGTVGGLYAFDTIDNARRFALEYFPTEAASLNAAFTTRIFDARVVAAASREMQSPFYG